MMGRKHRVAPQCEDPIHLSNNLNMFYSRFDGHDFSDECDSACAGMTPALMTLKVEKVISILQ